MADELNTVLEDNRRLRTDISRLSYELGGMKKMAAYAFHQYRTKVMRRATNWAVAADLFCLDATTGRRWCCENGIDPDATGAGPGRE